MNAGCRHWQGDFRGWNAGFLDNGLIRLAAVPDIGGRIMAYDLGPYPFFYVEPLLAGQLFSAEENQGDGSLAAWKNYGGDKTWPAPQGWDTDEQWHGPPDAVLDSGRYTLDELSSHSDSARVRMVSPPDGRTGVQITRQFTICAGSSRVQAEISFTNIKDKPIRWSIWDVAQLRAERHLPDGGLTYEPGCVVTAPLNPNSRFAQGYEVMFGAPDNPQWQANRQTGLFRAPYRWHIGKIGLDSVDGWIAFSNTAAGCGFVERFDYEPGATYPDAGYTVEIWSIGAGQVGNLNYAASAIYHMETEVLSPLRVIQPGASTTFTLEWAVCRCGGEIMSVSDAGAVVEPLRAQAAGEDFVQLIGQFGVFDAGELRLAWLDDAGQTIQAGARGLVDPFGVLRIDRLLSPPPNAHAIELRVAAASGERLLARASITPS